MNNRLSKRQMEIIVHCDECRKRGLFGYEGHIEKLWYWESYGELKRFMENLVRRGFLVKEGTSLFKITEKGTTAVAGSVGVN